MSQCLNADKTRSTSFRPIKNSTYMTKNNTLLAWQSTRRRKLFVAIGLTLFLLLPLRATVTVLHSFSDPEGSYPYGSLLRTGSLLYGMTTGDGGGTGVLFRMNTDGTGFGTLHTFTGGSSDGRLPYGSLTESGAKLFGITYSGGVLNAGTIFTVNTDGTGFSLLHSFTSFPNDGGLPINSLTLAGTKLYGATYSGGSSFNGTIFSINTDGTGYSLLHNFTGGANGGANPLGTLVLSGTKLYGSSCNGGVGNKGTLFSVNTDGTGFSLLHTFTGGVNDGVDPRASLTLVGSKLYGTTIFGGASDAGTLFSINTDGSGFGLLHSFSQT